MHPLGYAFVPDGVDVPKDHRPQLYICVSCWRRGAEPDEGRETDGRRLFDELRALLDAQGAAAPVELLPTLCFANCERGCTAGIAAPGKWFYLMGELGPEHAGDLLLYARAYAAAKSGVVLPSGRPASMQKTVIARFPAQATPLKDAAE
jgi:predicted metal-binding protein